VQSYDIVRLRATAAARWIVGTVIATAGDTLTVALHGTPASALASRVALDTIASIERRVLVPGSRAKAAAEGLYWGLIAGGIMGWLGGATYGALAGGTTWSEGGERGVLVGASAIGLGGAITLGTRHMRGDNGPESIRVEWVGVTRSRQQELDSLSPVAAPSPVACNQLDHQFPVASSRRILASLGRNSRQGRGCRAVRRLR
jgi:hypothetical protein